MYSNHNHLIRWLHSPVCVALLLLFMTSSMAVGGEVKVKKLYGDNWIRMKSENFDVLSNANKKQTVLMIEELENFSFFMSKLLGYKPKPLTRKVPVILAKNRSSFQSLGISDDYAGLFSNVDGGLIFARADKFRSSSRGANWGRSVILHELTHLLINTSEFEIARPPWYREGIAEYLGTYVRKKDKVVLGDLSVLGNRFYSVLKRGGGTFENVDSESLFKVTQKELNVGKKLTTKQDKFVNKFYTRSVSVMHYLNADPQRRRQMYQFLSLLDKGYGTDESFEHIFKLSYSEFDQQINSYINGKIVQARVFYISENSLIFPATPIQAVMMSKPEVLSFLYNKISLLSSDILSKEQRNKMKHDIEEIVPEFFKQEIKPSNQSN